MAFTFRRWVGAVLIAAAVIGAGAGLYTVRDRFREQHGNHAPTPAPPDARSAPSDSAGPARGDISIDAQRQQRLGVRLATATRLPLDTALRTTGAVRYDETRMADVNVKLDGWIRDLYVDYTGQLIRQGQPLFTLYSPDLLATQNEFVLSLRTRDQMQGSPVADAREYAERLVEAARQRLMLWDLPPEEIAELERTRKPREAITFRSPVAGYVLEKQALKGMRVMPGQTLYKVADLSVVWVEADIYEQEMPLARVGQAATVTLDAYPGESFTGRAIYIYPFVEENTRTVKLRFQFANARGRLKPGMFANVEMRGSAGAGLTVPTDAVLDSGKQQVVFVAQGEGVFTPRVVKIGRRLADRIEIVSGLTEGEQVAAGANFFLDSESQLRAGLQNYESPQPAQATPSAGQAPTITFRSTPDPPKTGENVFEATVKDPAGQPMADADVVVQLFMPAMPTMNMPAMRSEMKLAPAGGGVYRGPGQVVMGGRWEVTVTVSKGGQRVGGRQFALVVR
jgi:membrane fusion protein, copper/silver efflux system